LQCATQILIKPKKILKESIAEDAIQIFDKIVTSIRGWRPESWGEETDLAGNVYFATKDTFLWNRLVILIKQMTAEEQAEFIFGGKAYGGHHTHELRFKTKYSMIPNVTDRLQLIMVKKYSSPFNLNDYDCVRYIKEGNRKIIDDPRIVDRDTSMSQSVPRDVKIGILTQRYIAEFIPESAYMLYGDDGFYKQKSKFLPDAKAILMTIKFGNYTKQEDNVVNYNRLAIIWKDLLDKAALNNVDYTKLNKEQKIALVSKNGALIAELYHILNPAERMDQDIIIAALENNVDAVIEILRDFDPKALNSDAIKLIIQDIKL